MYTVYSYPVYVDWASVLGRLALSGRPLVAGQTLLIILRVSQQQSGTPLRKQRKLLFCQFVICQYLYKYFPIFRRQRTDLHQNSTRIRVLLSYSTSRLVKESRDQGKKVTSWNSMLPNKKKKRLTIIGPTWISKNHVINHTTYAWMDVYVRSLHTCIHRDSGSLRSCRFGKLVWGRAFPRIKMGKGQLIDQNHRACEMVPRIKIMTDYHVSGQKMLQIFES